MRCGSCGTENPADSRFCMDCGQPIEEGDDAVDAVGDSPVSPATDGSPAEEPSPGFVAPGPPPGQVPGPAAWPTPPATAPVPQGPPSQQWPAQGYGPPVGAAPTVAYHVPTDPNLLGVATHRLSPRVRSTSRAALAVAGALLVDGERVEIVVAGRLNGAAAVAVLTDQQLLVASDREWKPEIQLFEVNGSLTVQGWESGRNAALVFTAADRQVVVADIADTPLAHELAGRLRARAGGAYG